MKIRIYWILYPLYVFFVYWAFKYEMVEKYRTFFGSCFLIIPIILELIRKFENKNGKTTKSWDAYFHSLADGNISPKGKNGYCRSGEPVKGENFIDYSFI